MTTITSHKPYISNHIFQNILISKLTGPCDVSLYAAEGLIHRQTEHMEGEVGVGDLPQLDDDS